MILGLGRRPSKNSGSVRFIHKYNSLEQDLRFLTQLSQKLLLEMDSFHINSGGHFL